jgi:8-oxo-dGTP diphosphatase
LPDGFGYNAPMNQSWLRYTLIFLTRAERILMLHRRRPPNQGLWNGIGGRIEPGESALAGALREVHEETGFQLDDLHFAGILTWDGFETPPGGLYIYTAEALEGDVVENGEGELAWKPRDWVFSDPGVVSNIHVFGPVVFNGSVPQEYYFEYRDGAILRYEFRELPAWLKD